MIINSSIASAVSLEYSNGKVMYISDGDIAGLQIKYECTGNIHINAPENWLYHSNNNTIVMVSIEGKGNLEDGSSIIEYNGDFILKSARVVTWDNKSWVIKPHQSLNYDLYPKGTIYKVTDDISNNAGLTTIASSSKKINENTDSTFKDRLVKENIKNSNLAEIKTKAEEELGYNVGGAVIRDVIAKKPKKKINFGGALPVSSKSSKTGGSY